MTNASYLQLNVTPATFAESQLECQRVYADPVFHFGMDIPGIQKCYSASFSAAMDLRATGTRLRMVCGHHMAKRLDREALSYSQLRTLMGALPQNPANARLQAARPNVCTALNQLWPYVVEALKNGEPVPVRAVAASLELPRADVHKMIACVRMMEANGVNPEGLTLAEAVKAIKPVIASKLIFI